MSEAGQSFDVAIVGAGLAGCAAARLFAERGLSVALVEQHSSHDWYKRLCTHYIQASAVPTIERLGLMRLVEAAGGVRSRMEIWTRWGWIRHAADASAETCGLCIRRETLDPLLRRLATETPGVTLLSGWSAHQLRRDGDRIVGLVLQNPQGATIELCSRLVVAADGRNSMVARLAEVPLRERPNQRFATFAYYRNLPLQSGRDSQFWMCDPDAGYALPNDDGVTLLCCWLTKDKLAAFQQDRESAFQRFFASVPNGPDLSQAQRIGELYGALDLPLLLRVAHRSGYAAIGDAALSADPFWGVGCGWALQSAEWLVESVAPALLTKDNLDRALRKYIKRHRAALGSHYLAIASYATGRRFSWLEKLYFKAAANDPVTAELILAFGARRISALRLLWPNCLARALRSCLRASFRRQRDADLGERPTECLSKQQASLPDEVSAAAD